MKWGMVKKMILAEMEKDPFIQQATIAKNLGLSKATVCFHIKGLLSDGRLSQTPARWNVKEI